MSDAEARLLLAEVCSELYIFVSRVRFHVE
jgi:hypothetical protein